jgi:protein ImuB
MRVACLYLPSFPLQTLIRRAPHLAARPLAIASDGCSPRLLSVSRAAFDAGIRPGMSPAQARGLAPELIVRAEQSLSVSAALDALAESLMVVSPAVDVGDGSTHPHKAIFVEVPSGSRGATFGDKLLAATKRHGMQARVGIADDRFTAWVAAAVPDQFSPGENQLLRFSQSCTTVPRGGSAVFLAPLPLSILPLDDHLRQILASLKIRTVGDFAALPPPTIARRHARWTSTGVDVHELARGASSAALSRFRPQDNVVELLELEDHATDVEPIAFVLHPVADRIADRLRGRRRAASGITVSLHSGGDAVTSWRVPLPQPTASARGLLDAVRSRLISVTLTHPVQLVRVEVIAEGEVQADELELFAASPHRRTRRGKRRSRHTRQTALPLPNSAS